MVGAERALFRGAVQWVANARWDGRSGLRALVVALRPDGPRRDRRACSANVPRHAAVGACLLLGFAAQAHRSRRGLPRMLRVRADRSCEGCWTFVRRANPGSGCGLDSCRSTSSHARLPFAGGAKKTPALRPASLVADHGGAATC